MLTLVLVCFSSWNRKLFSCAQGGAHDCILNDNFCDCGDDEPETSACSTVTVAQNTFQCVDREYIDMKLPSSRVNDGICDCCDGSDEKAGIVKCNDTCAEVGAEEAARKREMERVQSIGFAKKQEMIASASLKLNSMREASAGLQIQIQAKEDAISKHEERKLEVANQSKDQEQVLTKAFKEQIINVFLKVLPKDPSFIVTIKKLLCILALVSGEEGIESILKDIEVFYEFPGRDPDDTEALVLAIDYSKSQREVSVDINGDYQRALDESIHAMMGALAMDRLGDLGFYKILKTTLLRASKHKYLATALQIAQIGTDQDSLLHDIDQVMANLSGDNSGGDIDVIDTLISEDTKLLDQFKLSLNSNEQILSKDFGDNSELFDFDGKCFSAQDRKFSYQVCPFGDATQDGRTLLGHYTRYRRDNTGYYLEFDHGERCFNTGLPRSLLIKMECSEHDTALVEIVEPNVCQYVGTLKTPVACAGSSAPASPATY